ncbi:hypothetical protein EJD97_001253 [Solanum chilense]|uniref:Brf1 TBP-binding domain-containing protein n=1 Tax=Solanum chilense TaxID=4083 RepID=A0A6N2CBW7_SOLCI|nr:hypothetical protein EJD97_001253 [Solanum chilense]
MVITGRPADNGKSTEQRVVGESEVKSNLVAEGRLVKNVNACRGKFQDIDQRKRVAAAGNLSGIDDSEVVGYLSNTKEIHYKTIIWEKMNKEFAKGNDKLHAKKRKREIGHKKDVHAKKSAKTTEKVENKRTSSKINYNALQKLTDELACANGDSAENLKIGFHEFEQENKYGEYDDSFRENDDSSYYGYGTGYHNNSEDFDANYEL